MQENHPNRILIIDDEKELCSILNEYLTEEGYIVDYSHDGQTGIEMIKSKQPDIIILDHRMPGWDGSLVLKKVREFSSVPILCVSAISDQKIVDDCLSLGANAYICKPVKLDDLLQTIRLHLNT